MSDDLRGFAARVDMMGDRKERLERWISIRKEALDEALDLLRAVSGALRDNRITGLEAAEICRKARALADALGRAKGEP